MKSTLCEEEWRLVESLLPGDLEMSARQSGALQRARGVKDAQTLLRLLLLHVAGGLSLEQTVLRAEELGLAQISAVALFKRLRGARPWLEELCAQVIAGRITESPREWPLPDRTFRVLDASDIREPGAKGSSWRLHYSITLPGLRCDFARFTRHTTGERLQNLPVRPGDVVLADRAYGNRAQLAWLMDAGADAVIRLYPPAFPAFDGQSEADNTDLPVDWLAWLDTLPALEPGECTVRFVVDGRPRRVRVCAIRKSATAAAAARAKLEAEARKKKRKVRETSIRLTSFVVVLTTLGARELSTRDVLEVYRCRWQVELAFKRLKSLLAFSSVPKSDEDSARSWMQTKLLESLLIERLLEQSGSLSPWGYSL